jgi:hypothetical protein
MLVYPIMLDLVGAQTMLSIALADIHFVWKNLDPVATDVGLPVTPDVDRGRRSGKFLVTVGGRRCTGPAGVCTWCPNGLAYAPVSSRGAMRRSDLPPA